MNIDFETVQHMLKRAAIEELLPRFTLVSGSVKDDGSVVTEADFCMQNRLQSELMTAYPNTVLLSEEMSVAEQETALTSGKPIWCLDPLDGTSNYAAGIPYFAVSLSLIQNKKVIMGLVYDPIREECFFAQENMPATLNNNKIKLLDPCENIYKAMAIIDLKRLDKELLVRLVEQQPFASQRNFGASALDWCWLAANRGQLYLHGNQNIWDYSAGNFILQKAGGFSCTLQGEDIFCSKLVKRSVVAATNKPLLDDWFSWLDNKHN